MSWTGLIALATFIQAIAAVGDAMLRKGERTRIYDGLLSWWDRIDDTTIPNMPRVVVKSFCDALEIVLHRAHCPGRALLLASVCAALAVMALSSGCYIDWSGGASYVPIEQGFPFGTTRVAIRPVSFRECVAAATTRSVGLSLVAVAVPCYLAALYFGRWFWRTIIYRRGMSRILIGFFAMCLGAYTAFPLSAAGDFIGLEELLFRWPPARSEGTAILLYVFAVVGPVCYGVFVIPFVAVLWMSLRVTKTTVSRLLGGLLERDPQTFGPLSLLATVLSLISAVSNLIVKLMPDDAAIQRAVAVAFWFAVALLVSTVWLLSLRLPPSRPW